MANESDTRGIGIYHGQRLQGQTPQLVNFAGGSSKRSIINSETSLSNLKFNEVIRRPMPTFSVKSGKSLVRIDDEINLGRPSTSNFNF